MEPRGPAAEEIRTVAERSRDALGRLREGVDAAQSERQQDFKRLSDEALALVEQITAEIAGELANDFERRQAEQAEAANAALGEERAAFVAEREAWLTERESWEAVRGQIEAELAAIETRLVAEAQALNQQRAKTAEGVDVNLLEKLETALSAQEQAEQRYAEAQTQIAELTAALEAVTDELNTAGESGAELATLREKFDLALADLQSHREHVESLEQQLAERPSAGGEADAATLAELEELRSERDDLKLQLERAQSESFETAPEELSDLRARFEMAVDDVRRLKTENSELRDQLAAGTTTSAPAGDGNDWEAQKRRLLASLEGEGEPDDPQRQEERAQIAGAIQITDEVVAEKDREIERLRAELSTSSDSACEKSNDAAVAALLDEDEVIRAERERLAQLEAEWRDKLRSAELELSVERAKITRAQSELAEHQLELETLRAAGTKGAPAAGESHRNWFNKLGLGQDGS